MMIPHVTRTVLRRPSRRFLARAAVLALSALLAVPTSAAGRRFFRPAQSTLPSPSFAPATPTPPPLQPSPQQNSPAEPTLALPPTSTPAAPMTDAPRFVVPTLKTPTLPVEPSVQPVPVPTPVPATAPVQQFPRAVPVVPRQTMTSLRPDGAACLQIDVTAAYLNRLVSTPRQDAGPVRDMILGARVEGEQTTQSTVWIRTIPCPQIAKFDVNLGGESCSRTTAVTPQAAIDIAGRQKFDLHKSVDFDGVRFTTRSPATHLETSQRNLRARTGASQIPVVNSIAETIALNQANLRQPLARQEAARQVTNRVTPTFNQAIDERLGAANDWLAGLTTTAPNLHSFLTSSRWSSTDAAFNGQLLASVPVDTPAPPSRGGATVRLHESFAPSLSAALQLNGREISVDEVRRWIGIFSSDVSGHPENSSLTAPGAAVSASLKLADDNPLSYVIQNNEFRVVLRASIRAEGIELPIHRIMVGYSIRRLGDSFQLEPLPVLVQAEASGTIAADTVESVIKSQIESRLQPVTISAEAIPPTANGVRPRISDVTAENGWLTVVFD